MKAAIFKQLGMSAGLGLAMFAAMPAAAQTGVVDQLLERADRVYDLHGYAQFGWERQDLLKSGEEKSFSVTLTGASEYSLIGVCDRDCVNLDIYVTDDAGVEVTRDAEDDDYPVVYIKRGGSFKVRVVMKACTDAPCEFGIKAFKM